MLEPIPNSQQWERGPRIVAIGGGTGLSTMLRGLKSRTRSLTAIVTVADDGGGTRETVERLNRGLGSTKAEGLGLGLSIVRGILEAYGGRLAFSARRQGGLVARVTVPVREVSGEPSPLDDDSLATGDNAVRDNRDEKAS